ncbi:TetR/AcrR family transcriptional regulator [Actinocrispum wychmicini]|uniref:TetR family transcriptional regulator n=1 Tax=Actinocrispum wychmicini TaxID=1213861 RepID=A0A4R2JMR6_9PSEU|nr:TetR/AcrR family transcriptional regulator [Actinocrispum wychmicini]TCO57939.1 TetR family transcriptional regulator [Actinocrispum wychmicini]
MAATARTPRGTWIEEGLRALAEGGPDAVRVDVLAKALGVTRGSFYWHFKDRGALLEALLDTWERMGADEVIARVEAEGADARDKVRLLAARVPATALMPVDLAVRAWARRDPAVAERLRRVDNRRMAYLRALFSAFCPDPDDVEARSMLAFSLAIANQSLAADHGERSRADVLDLATQRLLT